MQKNRVSGVGPGVEDSCSEKCFRIRAEKRKPGQGELLDYSRGKFRVEETSATDGFFAGAASLKSPTQN